MPTVRYFIFKYFVFAVIIFYG